MVGGDARQPSPRPAFFRRFLGLAGGYWRCEKRVSVRLLTAALVLLTIGQVCQPVMFNLWSKRLFDALEQRSMDRLWLESMMILGIIAFNIAIQVLHLRVKRRLIFGWRTWLSQKVLGDWLSRGRHHQLTYLSGDHDNPDGRIAEDIRITVEYAIQLGHSLLYCALLLISFTNILWMLSGSPEVSLAGMTVHVPGYLLYIALIYAAVGTSIALLLGRPLVRAVNRRQGYEADYRFGLVRVREHAKAIALLHAESEERRRLFDLLRGVRKGWYGQTRGLAIVTYFSAGYSVLCAAFPFLIAAPRYISGAISLGMLMQTAQAFQQTVAALSWPIDNLGQAAEWKASVERVLGLLDSLGMLDRQIRGEGVSRIQIDHSETAHVLTFDNLAINDASGAPVIESFSAEIQPGERVFIAGDPAAALSLFRAVARVWPWGQGRILLPAHSRVFFMPQRPYLPLGTLRNALVYPFAKGAPADPLTCQALKRVGLGYLVPRLDDQADWGDVLVLAEQQRLGFARLLLRRPDWIFVAAATDSLGPAGEEEMMQLMNEEFPQATLLTIGTNTTLEAHHARKFVLERNSAGVVMREVTSEATPA